MTPEQIKLRNAIASTLYVNGYVTAETPSRNAADAVMRVLQSDAAPSATPERCDSRFLADDGREYVCHVAAGHRSEFHLDTQALATWSRAGDLTVRGAPVIQGADCGIASGDALCTRPVGHPGAHYDTTVGLTWTADDPPAGLLPRVDELTTRLAAGTVMDVQSVRRYQELLKLAAPSEDGALNLGPIVARNGLATNRNHFHGDIAASQADVVPLMREVMRLRRWVAEIKVPDVIPPVSVMAHGELVRLARELSTSLAWFVETRCTGCPIVANSSNPEDGANIEPQPNCPVHGQVAELRRSLDWATQQHERIAAALGPEYTAPFGPDTATAAVNCITTARGIDDVLRAAGIEHPLGLRGVEDLASQRDGALEHVTELRDAVKGAIYGTVHHGHSPTLDECEHHVCVALRTALSA